MAPEARRGSNVPAPPAPTVAAAARGWGCGRTPPTGAPPPSSTPQTGSLSTATQSSIRPAVADRGARPRCGRPPPRPRSSGRTAGSTRPRPSRRPSKPLADRSARTCSASLRIQPRSSASSSGPSQARALSTSELGNGSKRPKLPVASQVYGTGGGPRSACARSIRRRVALSWMLAIAREIAATGSSASCRAITVSGSSDAARATAAASGLRAISARSRNGARRSLAIRSTSSSTPIRRRPASSTGRWRTPWSSISSRASVPVRSPATVQAGALITSDSGVSGAEPAATTRSLMSRSVTMPSWSPRSTTAQVTPASTIRRAASWTVVAGSQTSGAARISSRTGRPAGDSTGSCSRSPSSRTRLLMDRATKRAAAGRSNTGVTAAAGMR